MNAFFDAHCHININSAPDFSGAGRFICNATEITDWDAVISAANRWPNVYGAIGVHPWYVGRASPDAVSHLREKLVANPDVSVGEIGLDRARSDWQTQCKLFTEQYGLAAELGRVVHIHCVRAWDEILRVIRDSELPPALVFHRFSASGEIIKSLQQLTNNRAYFSYNAATGSRTVRLIMETPLDRLLIESDSNAPAPERVVRAIRDVAAVRGVSENQMTQITYDNAMGVVNVRQTA